jgi:hypothetical protein
VTSLGKNISQIEAVELRNEYLKQAVLHVRLWKMLYDKYKRNLPDTNKLALDIRDILGISMGEAHTLEKDARKWYLQDIRSVTDDSAGTKEDLISHPLDAKHPNGVNTSSETKSDGLVQQQSSIKGTDIPVHLRRIYFGDNILICLPEQNMRKWWEKAKKHMDLFLDDREES